MNITQLEKEIIKAIKIEEKEIGFLTDKHNEEKEVYGFKGLITFVKKCFKDYERGV